MKVWSLQRNISMPLSAHLTRLEQVQVTYLIVKREGLAFFLCGGDWIPKPYIIKLNK